MIDVSPQALDEMKGELDVQAMNGKVTLEQWVAVAINKVSFMSALTSTAHATTSNIDHVDDGMHSVCCV